MTATEGLVGQVRRRLTDASAAATPASVIEAVRAEPAHAALGSTALLQLGDRLYDDLVGAGPLAGLLADPAVTDVVVNGPGEVWVDRGDGMVRASITFPDAEAVRRLAQRLAAACERRLDSASPRPGWAVSRKKPWRRKRPSPGPRSSISKKAVSKFYCIR